MIITIDGPAGSGKSTVAKQLARELEYDFLDTGAMYRAFGWYVLEKSLANDQEVVESLSSMPLLFEQDQIIINGQDITSLIRTSEVTEKASIVAIIPEVRTYLVKLQREFANGKNVVSEGRDQGTVVFPNAEFKFYLTASVEKRAKRRLNELTKDGSVHHLNEIEKQICERDNRDTTRDTSPLRIAEDAKKIDTSNMNIPEVVGKLKEIVDG